MDFSSFQPFLDWLDNHQGWTAAAIFFIAFLESLAIAGVIIPGVLLLFAACAIAGNGNMGVWITLGCAFAGAILGDGVSFFLGKYFKEHIKELWPFRNYPSWITNGEIFFERHGGKSIIIGRFVGPVRPVMPLVAGMLGMPSMRYLAANLFSAFGWAPVYVMPGFWFGASIGSGQLLPEGVGQLFLYSLVIIACAYLVIKLSHWHLSKESRLYRVLHVWAERQHNVRIFWHWLSSRRGQQRVFPLLSLLLALVSFSVFVLLTFHTGSSGFLMGLDQQSHAFFNSIKHPLLDNVFNLLFQIGNSWLLLFFEGVLIVWLLFERHIAAAILCIATILTSTFLLMFLVGIIGSSFLGLSANVVHATLLFGLSSAFIAQEMDHKDRWWIYGSAFVPIMLIGISLLYLNSRTLSDVVASLFYGLVFCGLCRLVFSRYDKQPIKADVSFYIALASCFLVAIFYLVQR